MRSRKLFHRFTPSDSIVVRIVIALNVVTTKTLQVVSLEFGMMNEESIDLPFGGNEAVDRMFVIHFPAWRRLHDCVDQENKIFKLSLSSLVVLCYTFSAKDFASKADLGSQAEWYRLYGRRQTRDLQSDVGQQIPDLILPPLPSRPVFIFLLLVGPSRQ